MLMAFQSVILLVILRRTMDLAAAGIFTIANANANLFVTIGRFGMRNFQVSDVKRQFSFAEYRCSRIISVAAMIAVSCIYVLISSLRNGYSVEKSLIIIWMCLYKVVDAAEDVYYGEYQQKDRLDVGAKALTLRMIVTMIIFSAAVIITRNLLVSMIISTVMTALIAFVLVKITSGEFEDTGSRLSDKKQVMRLMWLCMPLFLGAFLAFYIGNAPKYSIDAILSDELQACYGFIAMPVFVIGLLNNFIFSPLIYKMSCMWNENKIGSFIKRTCIQSIIVCIITVLCIVAAYICGIPILSWLYNTDLSAYKTELLVMLLGGGFLGLSGLFNIIITIMRRQKALLIGYVITAVLALAFSNTVVRKYGIMGATAFYTAIMLILCVVFAVIFVIGIVKKKGEKVCSQNA